MSPRSINVRELLAYITGAGDSDLCWKYVERKGEAEGSNKTWWWEAKRQECQKQHTFHKETQEVLASERPLKRSWLSSNMYGWSQQNCCKSPGWRSAGRPPKVTSAAIAAPGEGSWEENKVLERFCLRGRAEGGRNNRKELWGRSRI